MWGESISGGRGEARRVGRRDCRMRRAVARRDRSVLKILSKRRQLRRTLAQLQGPLVGWCIFRSSTGYLGRAMGRIRAREPDLREDVAVRLDLCKRTAW